jgi:hypothetical protein
LVYGTFLKLGRFSKKFLGWCTHGKLYGNFLKLGRFSKKILGRCTHGNLYGTSSN